MVTTILSILIGLIMMALSAYYVYVAYDDDGKFDKREFDRLVLYVLLFTLLVLLINGHDNLETYFGMLLGFWWGKENIKIGKHENTI